MAPVAVWLLLLASPDAPGELVTAYREAAAARDWDCAADAARALARSGNDRAIALLQVELEAAEATEHRRILIAALVRAEFSGVEQFLAAHGASPDPYVRPVVLEAWAERDERRARARAAALVEGDEDRRVRSRAAAILSSFGDAGAAGTILRAAARSRPDEQADLLLLVARMPGGAAGASALTVHPDREVRWVAVRALAEDPAAAERPVLERALKDRDRRVALVARAALDRIAGAEAPSSLRARLEGAADFGERWRLCDLVCATHVRDPAAAEVLAAWAASGEDALRPKAAEALGHAARAAALETLVPLAEDRRWPVAVGAVRGLAASRAREAVPPLLALLENSAGRVRHEVALALESLTGQPFGDAVEVWRRWWIDQGGRIAVPDTPVPPPDDGQADRYHFYGVELHSRSALFLCDLSESMEGAPLEKLQRELAFTVTRFPAQGSFNLVFFDADVRPWAPRLRRASPTAKRDALRFTARQRAMGPTNLWKALCTAFDTDEADTVVLLTDGLPNAGRIYRMDEIRRRFEMANRGRMLVLHVISLGKGSSDLRAMAEGTGGTYVER